VRFLLSTGSLHTYGLVRCFQFAAQAGFDGVEVLADQRWDTRQPAYLQLLMARFNLPILAIHSPFFEVPGWPSDQPAAIATAVGLAEAVGAEVVVHHLPLRIGYAVAHIGSRRIIVPIPGWGQQDEYRQWLLRGYGSLQRATEVTLCIENMPKRSFLGRRLTIHYWNTAEGLAQFPHVTMDTTHIGTWGAEPVDIYSLWRERVQHVHLSNFDGREHRRPEVGHLQLDRLLQALARDGYSGTVTLELAPDTLDAGRRDDHIVQLLTTSLRHCRQWAGMN
jgi:sugar phosphate isomerase/epimerase